MSWYTINAVTVSAEKAEAFIDAINKDEEYGEDFICPNVAKRHPEGCVTLIWEWQNHFPCLPLLRLLNEAVGEEDYYYTSVDEEYDVEYHGSGPVGYQIEMFIEPCKHGDDITVSRRG